MLRCDFCGHEFEEKDAGKGCGKCSGGCIGFHCPKCRYKVIPEPKFVTKIKSFFEKEK